MQGIEPWPFCLWNRRSATELHTIIYFIAYNGFSISPDHFTDWKHSIKSFYCRFQSKPGIALPGHQTGRCSTSQWHTDPTRWDQPGQSILSRAFSEHHRTDGALLTVFNRSLAFQEASELPLPGLAQTRSHVTAATDHGSIDLSGSVVESINLIIFYFLLHGNQWRISSSSTYSPRDIKNSDLGRTGFWWVA